MIVEPRRTPLLPSQVSGMETLALDWRSQEHKAPSTPTAPNWKAIFPGEPGHHNFSRCPQLLVTEVEYWECGLVRLRDALFH